MTTFKKFRRGCIHQYHEYVNYPSGAKEMQFCNRTKKLCRHNLCPLMGAGTTAKAAKYSGRQYIGFELNPEYVKLANKRVAQETLTF
jgi:hypothetical protein